MNQPVVLPKGKRLDAPQTFSYAHPGEVRGMKRIMRLCESDLVRANVQVVKEGGENNLHTHHGADGIWMVLEGRVRFYGPGDEVIGEFGKHEGILIPRGYHYWFESADESQDLQLLQIHSYQVDNDGKRVDDRRLDSSARKAINPEDVEITVLTRNVG